MKLTINIYKLEDEHGNKDAFTSTKPTDKANISELMDANGLGLVYKRDSGGLISWCTVNNISITHEVITVDI